MSYWGKSSLKASYYTELLKYCVIKKKQYFHKIVIFGESYEIQRDNQWIIELPFSFKSKKLEAVTCVFSHWGAN